MVENGLHCRRDVTLGEDSSRIRKGNVPRLMASLRNLMLFVRKRSGREKLTTAIPRFMCHSWNAVELVSTPI